MIEEPCANAIQNSCARFPCLSLKCTLDELKVVDVQALHYLQTSTLETRICIGIGQFAEKDEYLLNRFALNCSIFVYRYPNDFVRIISHATEFLFLFKNVKFDHNLKFQMQFFYIPLR